jgi:hypothetical protein
LYARRKAKIIAASKPPTASMTPTAIAAAEARERLAP